MAILANEEKPLSLAQVGEKMLAEDPTIDKPKIIRSLTRLARTGRVSFGKTPGEYGRYFLTANQLQMFTMGITKPPAAKPPARRTVIDGVTAVDISIRLNFLIDISGRPAFDASAVLKAIIKDYRRALSRVAGKEDAE